MKFARESEGLRLGLSRKGWPIAGYFGDLVTALGTELISLVSGTGGLALIGLFAMLPWPIAGLLKMA
jgi:hypothetical protein